MYLSTQCIQLFDVTIQNTHYSRLRAEGLGDGSEVRRLFGPGSEVCLTVNLGGFKYCIGPAR